MAILGIDEVGRGPWAGPLVIGAVILPENKPNWINELTDSKKLSIKKREILNELILKESPATGLGWVSSRELDENGLSNALKLATRRAIEEVRSKHVPFREIIIDGTVNFLAGTSLEPYTTTLKKADFLIKEVSAASIIAKVARDHYMYDLAKKYPEYGFDTHVGYGTAAHKKALEIYGPCPEHRMSFSPLKHVFCEEYKRSVTREKSPTSRDFSRRVTLEQKICSTGLGQHAEDIVASYLTSINHTVIARNHKTKFYEIDIISIKDDKIYFTEVKYRKSEYRGTTLNQITSQKLKQMHFAAESFLQFKPQFKKYNPLLAAASVASEEFKIQDWFVIE